jgi:hypothetical protein
MGVCYETDYDGYTSNLLEYVETPRKGICLVAAMLSTAELGG